MAEPDTDSLVTRTWVHYIELAAAKGVSEAEKKEAKDKAVNKLLKECCGDKVAKLAESSVFPKYCNKSKKLELTKFLGDFMLELAACQIQDKKKLTKRPDLKDPDVQALATELKQKIAAKAGEKKKVKEVDSVTARLTDVSGYTGSHKERFDAETGKGKGITGRENVADTSGYVSGYKNKDTYEGSKK